MSCCRLSLFVSFFFNDTATTEIYTLSLHDALPIYFEPVGLRGLSPQNAVWFWGIPNDEYLRRADLWPDRKSTRLNSSHVEISYAVFCLKKKKEIKPHHRLYYVKKDITDN